MVWCIPAHFKEEAVSPSHPLQLVLVLLQEINVTFFRDKLKQLWRCKDGFKRCVYYRMLRDKLWYPINTGDNYITWLTETLDFIVPRSFRNSYNTVLTDWKPDLAHIMSTCPLTENNELKQTCSNMSLASSSLSSISIIALLISSFVIFNLVGKQNALMKINKNKKVTVMRWIMGGWGISTASCFQSIWSALRVPSYNQ